jgi:CheY-like chemotaxis protein
MARVLIVEDDALTRKFFATVARTQSSEIDVVEAATVATACARVAESEFALVITDIHLSDGTGVDVLQAIRRSAYPAIAVVAVTGLTGSDAEGLEGFDTVLSKPVNVADLRAVLARTFPVTKSG